MKYYHSSRIKISKAINVPWIIFTLLLVSIALLGVLNRFGGGYELLSDEIFFLSGDFVAETQRTIFMRIVQSLAIEDVFTWIVIGNLLLFIVIYKMVSVINKNHFISFFQVLYISVLVSFILRDIYIYFIFISIWLSLKKNHFFSENKKFNIFSIYSLIILFMLILLVDFRPLYTLMIIAGIVASMIYKRIGFYRFSFVAVVFLIFLNNYLEYFLLNINVYGLSFLEYLNQRAYRYEEQFTSNTLLFSFVQHYIAPFPWSLLERALDTSYTTIYPLMDDLIRMIYRSGLYFMVLYIAFQSINNYNLVKQVISRNKYEIVFITTFCLLNAVAYSLFLFGGGHERTKMFSSIAFFYVASLISGRRI